MKNNYEMTKAAIEDWHTITHYTLSNKGEAELRKLYKDLNETMKKMAKDHNSWRYTVLLGYTINIDHCDEYFILGMLRENKPLLVFAILHEETEHMKRLAKNMHFFNRLPTVAEMLEQQRKENLT